MTLTRRASCVRHTVTTIAVALLCCSLVQAREASSPAPLTVPTELDLTVSSASSMAPLTRVQRHDVSEEVVMSSKACLPFNEGNPDKNEFYSPNYPYHYPNNTECVRVLDAGSGQIIKLDFRYDFNIEPSNNCAYDYLEVRDGGHGYDHLIGKFCGHNHPPTVIQSKGRHLWVHFRSDESIEYSGFTAVYEFAPRPTSNTPDPPEMEYCRIHRNGSEGFIRHSDIDQTRVDIATEYQSPLDCMWVIRVAEGWKILLSFLKFELEKPNDCESNYVWVFKERTDIPSVLKKYCGAMADMISSDGNVMHIRYYADKSAYGSKFEAIYTAFREGNKKGCAEDEFDCQDDTCISKTLRCNKKVNCRFRWDEDENECAEDRNRLADIISADHIIIILVIFCLILSIMCFAFLYNCIKKLIHDHKIIREHLRQSRQSRLDEVGKTAPPLMSMSPRMTPSATRSRANSSSAGGGGNPLLADSEHDDSSPHRSAPEDCYVPAAGDLLPIILQANTRTSAQPPVGGVPANGDAVFLRDNHHHHHHQHYGEDECDDLEMSTFPLPEMRDNECQTRESLFLNTNSDNSMTPPPPPPPITPRYNSITTSDSRSMPRPPQHNSSSNTSGFSTFGYNNRGGSATRGGKDFSTLPQQGHHHHHHHHHHAGSAQPQPPPVPQQTQAQFRAEAVIEMEQQQQHQHQQRPFSVDSTKSAPDVIVTH